MEISVLLCILFCVFYPWMISWIKWNEMKWKTLKWLNTTLFRQNVQFWLFLENTTNGGAKHCVDLNPAPIFSSCNSLHHKMPYNKVSIVTDLFNSFGILNIFKNPIFWENWATFSCIFHRVYYSLRIWIAIMWKLFFFKLRALLIRKSCDVPLI